MLRLRPLRSIRAIHPAADYLRVPQVRSANLVHKPAVLRGSRTFSLTQNAMSNAGNVHKTAASGFGTGTNELYDRARPSYQPHVFSYLREQIPQTEPLNIVEIGSGTGIFTRALLASPDLGPSVGALRAFEPVEGMRAQFAKGVSDARVTQAEGAFDRLPDVPAGWADLLVIAQAFHWCPDHGAALRAFAHALRPGAPAALVWNLEDRDHARWVAQLRDRIESHEGGAPQFRKGAWRAVYDAPEYAELFEPPVEREWEYVLPTTAEGAVDRASSKSYIAILPDAEKAQVQADVREIVRRGDDLTWIDKEKGTFEYPYKTYVTILRRKK